MEVKLTRRLVSVSDYHRMIEAGILGEDDRVELLRGEIIEMSPIGSRHMACVNRITDLLVPLVTGRAIVSIQNPVTLDDLSEPEPDLAILERSEDFYASQKPGPRDVFLIIEVADSTLLKDREVKIPLYAEAGIPECWLVNLEDKRVEVYRTPLQGAYKFRELFSEEESLDFVPLQLSLKAKDLLG